MLQIIYASAAVKPFSTDALTTLLTKARNRNTLFGVSGMLLYHEGSFLQVLEGAPENVERIYKSIERDPRHANTKVLNRHELDRREFEGWSMGFVDTSTWGPRVSGKADYARALPQLGSANSAANKYLRFFRDGLCRQVS